MDEGSGARANYFLTFTSAQAECKYNNYHTATTVSVGVREKEKEKEEMFPITRNKKVMHWLIEVGWKSHVAVCMCVIKCS